MTTNYDRIKAMDIEEMAEHHVKFINSHIRALLRVIKENTGFEVERPLIDDEYLRDVKQWLQAEENQDEK